MKRYNEMTEDERIEHRIRTNREIEERAATVLAAQAAGKAKKVRRRVVNVLKELHDTLPVGEQAGFRKIVNDASDLFPTVIRRIGR